MSDGDEDDQYPIGCRDGQSPYRSPHLVNSILNSKNEFASTLRGMDNKSFLLLGRSLQKYGYDENNREQLIEAWMTEQELRFSELHNFCKEFDY